MTYLLHDLELHECSKSGVRPIAVRLVAPAPTLTGPHYTIGANLGKPLGGNLFRSFRCG